MTQDPNRRPSVSDVQNEADKATDRAANKAHDAVNRATDTAHSAVDNVADKAQNVAGNVKDTAQQVADKAQDVGTQVADKAQEVGAQALDRADAATTTVGNKMADAAQAIRQNAPASGPVSQAADTAADTLERAGTYLQQQDLSDIRSDLEGIIRRHPIESLLLGLGVGYLLARSRRR